ncbi:hypothetical protein JCGZ_16918 [Jatropha curcas]|uniref:Pectinesterase n=1 Tax=Jatropha curcas TaxID=180498 RepID=A0A067L583_JATCU|nr:pectinesterase [Jatropha curcas]KDP43631.1 hypothetical protein JCGZ_16918 [Jatropha curcas]
MMGKVVVSSFSLILVVGVVIGVVAVVQRGHEDGAQISSSTKNVAQICQPTDYKKACEQSLSNVNNTQDPKEFLKAAILATEEAAKKSFNLSSDLLVKASSSDNDTRMSLEDCKELLDDAVQELQASFSEVGENQQHTTKRRVAELQNWLSAVISYQQTCLDQFGDPNSQYKTEMEEGMVDAGQLTSNALAIVDAFSDILSTMGLKVNFGGSNDTSRKLLSVDEDGYPSWLSASRRRLLAVDLATLKPNVTVAADGSGDVKTVTEGIAKIPPKNVDPFYIYVKAGTYKEYPTVEKKMNNVFMYGDGPLKTIITGDHSNKTGYKTMRSATFAALGEGFTAKSIAFENTAGPEGHQAVALRVQADMAAFFDCKMDGYQDTLYIQTHRQFYSKCSVSGTIDFIFGDASCIIQQSDIVVRKPMPNQLNTVTAHGRADKHETTGLVFQDCRIIAEDKLLPEATVVKSYMGRPWRAYSRTVVMESEITNVIQPEGWLPWTGDQYLDTLEYLEYANKGDGANTDKRVNWKGFRIITDKKEAQQFTVEPFLQGTDWLNKIGEPYIAGLVN